MIKNDIKTFKYIKLTKYITLLYIFLCLISIVLFSINKNQYGIVENTNLFNIANASLYLWLVNPMALISSVVGFITYAKEMRDADKREVIKNSWVSFAIWSMISIFAWVIAGGCLAFLTGGI